jgi:hypothetical protein
LPGVTLVKYLIAVPPPPPPAPPEELLVPLPPPPPPVTVTLRVVLPDGIVNVPFDVNTDMPPKPAAGIETVVQLTPAHGTA